MSLRPLLISVRDHSDPMVQHELRCFEAAVGGPIDMVFAIDEQLNEGLLAHRPGIFFGGSGQYGVNGPEPWIRHLIDFMLLVVDRKVPAYASCFGFQGLAVALGGEVSSDPTYQEMGIITVDRLDASKGDDLFGGLPIEVAVPSGHNDHVSRLPSGVTLLATGRHCYHQALKVDGAPFWASQFHPELTKWTLIDRWNFYRDKFSTDPVEIERVDNELHSAPETPLIGSVLKKLLTLRCLP